MEFPRILYKYQAVSTHSVGNLASREVWFSRPASFNDPFDCAVQVVRAPISDGEFEEWFQSTRDACPSTELLAQFDARFAKLGSKDPAFRGEYPGGYSK